MKIILYQTYPKNLFSLLVAISTRSNITHASIINNGINYDNNLLKNKFSISDILIKEPDRWCYVYDLPIDCSSFLETVLNKKYNFLGIITWFFKYSPSERIHCFDSIILLLSHYNFSYPEDLKHKPTGSKLKLVLDDLGFNYNYMQAKDIIC